MKICESRVDTQTAKPYLLVRGRRVLIDDAVPFLVANEDAAADLALRWEARAVDSQTH